MKLTRQQRHIAYIVMLEEAKRPGTFYYKGLRGLFKSNHWGFCGMIRMLFADNIDDDEMPNVLPELFAKKPINATHYWFSRNKSGWESRIAILKQCIEETADAWPK